MTDPTEFMIDEWTTDVTLPAGKVQGIFDKQSAAVVIGIGINASQPQVVLLDADAAGLNDGDPVKILNLFTGLDEHYTYAGAQPDGEGLTLVDLEN